MESSSWETAKWLSYLTGGLKDQVNEASLKLGWQVLSAMIGIIRNAWKKNDKRFNYKDHMILIFLVSPTSNNKLETSKFSV